MLAGCGGGGGDQPKPPAPSASPMNTSCSASQTRGQCSECKCKGLNGACVEPVRCLSCKAPYAWQNTTSQTETIPDGECAFTCNETEKYPPAPANLMDLNGVAWPTACWDGKDEQHFFVIGDWGGMMGNPPTTFKNRPHIIPEIDTHAQSLVAARMADVAQSSKPKFVVNVGDNFYPGGIGGPGQCNALTGKTDATGFIIFKNVFETIYKGPGLDGVEWWGVLGNHDYGGYHYNVHWDQNIFYTWHSPDTRWLTPALYWSRKVQFRDFTVDFYFFDSNRCDTFGSPDVDPNHNICSRNNNKPPQPLTCPGTSMVDPDTCWSWFKTLWETQKTWLAKNLEASTAEWQIIVTHYPATWEPGLSDIWKTYFPKYGVDLYISGHTHQQQFVENTEALGNTPFIITGGGGGITSEIIPDIRGQDDAYGFMDLTITRDEIKVVMYSHGGVGNKTIVRGTHTVLPQSRSLSVPPEEVMVF